MDVAQYTLDPISHLVPTPVLAINCAGWSPQMTLPPGTKSPSFVRLTKPKEMSGTWRSSKDYLMSSFSFCVDSVVVSQAVIGCTFWKTKDWLSLTNDGFIRRDTNSVLERMRRNGWNDSGNNGPPVYDADGNRAHVPTRYDTIISGTMNDGTSLTLHVVDFIPEKIFKLTNPAKGLLSSMGHFNSVMDKIKKSNPELCDMTWKLEAKISSDGFQPSKRNPYNEKKYQYIVIKNPDASYASQFKLNEEMNAIGAYIVEDSALDEATRFKQMTKIGPSNWFVCTVWSERSSFMSIDQIEVDCLVGNIVPMLDVPVGLVMAPGTAAYLDIEQHASKMSAESSSSSKSKLEPANPDAIENNIICINAAVVRVGNFSVYESSDPCRRNLPRLDDLPLDVGEFFNVGSDVTVLPDPLEVEKSIESVAGLKIGISSTSNNDDIAESLMTYGPAIDDDNNCDELLEESSDDEESIEDGEAVDITKKMTDIFATINLGDTADCDLEAIDNFDALMTKKKSGEDIVRMETDGIPDHSDFSKSKKSDQPKDTIDTPLTKKTSSGMDVDKKPLESTLDISESIAANANFCLPESSESLKSRHGYEIPSWAVEKLKARHCLLEENMSRPKDKGIVTPILLNNQKYIRRISFFVDPLLDCNMKKILVPPLYVDDSDGIFVYVFKHEANMLLAFRDWFISCNPNMVCGHFFRSFDWRVIFAKANLTLDDNIMTRNIVRDTPVPMGRLLNCLPVLEFKDMLSTKEDPFPADLKDHYYFAAGGIPVPRSAKKIDQRTTDRIKMDAKRRIQAGKDIKRTDNLSSLFSYMNKFIFKPVHIVRKITHSANAATIESYYPSFDVLNDIDSLVAVRLNSQNLKMYGLNPLSALYLNDNKMDITIERMDCAYRQKQYWPIIAYCDYDCILVVALMLSLSIDAGNTALSQCHYISLDSVVNYGQQKRIYVKNAVSIYARGMVFEKVSTISPQLFGGGHVEIPCGGIYPVTVNCLDFASYYVTIMMEYGYCFATFFKPFNDNFDEIKLDLNNVEDYLKQIRAFNRRLRKIYGPPERKRRPASLPYFVCRRCESEHFDKLPLSVKTVKDLDSLPDHDHFLRWYNGIESPDACIAQARPSNCATCQSKPWLADVCDAWNNDIVADPSVEFDPYREERHAADFDYLVPRSSRVTTQADPEADLFHSYRRYKPKHLLLEGESEDVHVTEDIMTEYDEFDWTTDSDWASLRYKVGYRAFKQDLKDRKGKSKMTLENTPYVPSVASFVLWRPSDFDNQSLWIYSNKNKSPVAYIDEAQKSMESYLKEKVWTVDSFAAYADQTSEYANVMRAEAFMSRTLFDRGRFDIRHRRGVLKAAITGGNVEDLFNHRNSIKETQGEMKKDATAYDKSTFTWLDPVKKSQFEGLDTVQLKDKASANSSFGNSGAKTGPCKNTFVAAAITMQSRHFIYFCNNVTHTRWTPNEETWKMILKVRMESVSNHEHFKGNGKQFYKRFVERSTFPLEPSAARQVWIKPYSTAHCIKNEPNDSILGVKVIYGDTDSSMYHEAGIVQGDPLVENHPLDEFRREIGVASGRCQASFLTDHFRSLNLKFMTIEFEKLMYPLILFHKVKKRYISGHYTKSKKRDKITLKSWGIKRDMYDVVRNLCQLVKVSLIDNMNDSEIDQILHKYFLYIISTNGEINDLEKDVMPFSKSQAFKKTEYAGLATHIEANKRLAAEFPGSEYTLGSRIDYVICYNPKVESISGRAYTIKHIQLMLDVKQACIRQGKEIPPHVKNLRIDLPYYFQQFLTIVNDIYTITRPPKTFTKIPSYHTTKKSDLIRNFEKFKPRIMLPGASYECLLASCKLEKTDEDLRLIDEHNKRVLSLMFDGDDVAKAGNGLATVNDENSIFGQMYDAANHLDPSKVPAKRTVAARMIEKYSQIAARALKTSIGDVRESMITSFLIPSTAEDTQRRLLSLSENHKRVLEEAAKREKEMEEQRRAKLVNSKKRKGDSVIDSVSSLPVTTQKKSTTTASTSSISTLPSKSKGSSSGVTKFGTLSISSYFNR